jgi:RNA polymerase subunit RPABC4/transcription elongation factor Spt4
MQALVGGVVKDFLGGKLPEAASDYLMQAHMAIFPLTIANTVVDTLIFVLLGIFGHNLAAIIRSGFRKFPDLGQILNLAILTVVVAAAYYSYQGILFPFLWPNQLDLYGWAFLFLGLAPLVGIVILVSRNMDRITATVMRSGEKAINGSAEMRCGNCGQALPPGSKFCPSCGGVAIAAAPVWANSGKKFCPSCGVENPAGTRFCGGCGNLSAAD